MEVTSYRDLRVWQRAMDVAKTIYALADRMPKREEYRLTAQMIRAAVSIAANIAEGKGRGTRKDYAHFIVMARGSAAELETLLLIAEGAKLLPATDVARALTAVEEVGRMLSSLHAKLKNAPST